MLSNQHGIKAELLEKSSSTALRGWQSSRVKAEPTCAKTEKLSIIKKILELFADFALQEENRKEKLEMKEEMRGWSAIFKRVMKK